jgi:hypothetical protein
MGDGASEVRVGKMQRSYDGFAKPGVDGGTTITVREDLDAELLYFVLLHELGHHWGCRDNYDVDTVMNRDDGGDVRRLTIADFDCGS